MSSPTAAKECAQKGCTNPANKHCGKCGLVHYCSRECQQAAWPTHKWFCNPCVRIAHASEQDDDDGRGARLVALKPFKEGDELARERPFARMSHGDSIHASDEEAKAHGEGLWDEHVKTMKPGVERDLLFSLSDTWNDPPTAGGIGRTNCIPLGDHNDSEGSGLFAILCRANHSCRPNARYIWRHDLQRELLLAVRDIAPGEEVTVTYGPGLEGRAERQETLRRGFRFECKCEVCAIHAPNQDRALRKIKKLNDDIPQVAWKNPERAMRMAIEAVGWCKEYGMGSALWTKRFWHDAHQIAAQTGKFADAERYYNKAYEAALLCEGGLSPDGVSLRRYC